MAKRGKGFTRPPRCRLRGRNAPFRNPSIHHSSLCFPFHLSWFFFTCFFFASCCSSFSFDKTPRACLSFGGEYSLHPFHPLRDACPTSKPTNSSLLAVIPAYPLCLCLFHLLSSLRVSSLCVCECEGERKKRRRLGQNKRRESRLKVGFVKRK